MIAFRPVDVDRLRAVLCDADGNLFPSEEPAFEASATVTNAFLDTAGAEARFTAEELRLTTTGKNFRSTAVDLCVAEGIIVDPTMLDEWVAEEDRQVRAHLARVLQPDPAVTSPLRQLADLFELAVASSSATARLDACFSATGLDELIPAERRFSAQDSLPVPTSKPDPAIYLHAGRLLGVAGPEAIAVEDSVPGAMSAVAAGFPTIGNLVFVPEAERAERCAALRTVGVVGVVSSWGELTEAVASRP